MEQNPYQAPVADTSSPAITSARVEGKYLVVRSGTVLPAFCIKSNTPLSQEDMKQRRLSWCSPIVGLLILLSGLLLILVYFVLRKRCAITFGVSRAVRRRFRIVRIVKIVAVIVLFFALPLTAAIDNTVVSMTVLVLFLAAVVSLFLGNSLLTVTNHRQGEFWISGCSKEFLTHFETEAK